MIRKPVLGLAGALLAGAALAGCQTSSPNRSAFNPPAGSTTAAANRNGTTIGGAGGNSAIASRSSITQGGAPGLPGSSSVVQPVGGTGTSNFNGAPSNYNLPTSGTPASSMSSRSVSGFGNGSPSAMPGAGFPSGPTSTTTAGFAGSTPAPGGASGRGPDAFPQPPGSAAGGVTQFSDPMPPSPVGGRTTTYPDTTSPGSPTGVQSLPTPAIR